MGAIYYYAGDWFVQKRVVNHYRLAEIENSAVLDYLTQAVEREDYESAAKLRDEAIKRGIMPDPE